MLKEKLFTRSGGYVATVQVPPMQPPPEILMWGARTFIRYDDRYVEGLVWVIASWSVEMEPEETEPLMTKDLSTPLIDDSRERQRAMWERIEALPPLRWWQWSYWRVKYCMWRS